ncbi:MAG: DUF6160 family protein [Desulfomonilia bacterium]
MKQKVLFSVICVIVLIFLPFAGRAQMVALSDEQLCEVTGQAGIAFDATQAVFDTYIDNMTALGGILNYSDVMIKGAVEVRNPLPTPTDIVMPMNPLNSLGTSMMGLGMFGLGMVGLISHTVDMSIDIDQFSIGAIRIGPDVTGPSLGSFGMYGFHADIKGTVSITAY